MEDGEGGREGLEEIERNKEKTSVWYGEREGAREEGEV